MKIKLKEPSHYVFKTDYQVAINDVNYGGHVGNERYLGIAHETRIRYYRSLNITEHNLGRKDAGTIMANAIINYKAEAFHGDTLTISLGFSEIGSRSFELFYKFENQNGVLVALVSTTIVCYNYDLKKTISIPEEFLKMIQEDAQLIH